MKPTHDREFGRSFAWDNDLLAGYSSRFLPVRENWRMDRFRGIGLTVSWTKLLKDNGVTRLWVEGWRFWENWAAIIAAHKAGIEVLMRGETNDLKHRSGWRETLRRYALGFLFRKVDRFLCIGTANRRFYESFGIDENRLLSAPYCVDNALFRKKGEDIRGDKMNIRRAWGVSDDSFCILFCGKFIPKKRPIDLVLAAAKLRELLPEIKVHILFVGSGIIGSELRRLSNVVYDEDSSKAEMPLQNVNLPISTFAGFLNQGEIIRAYVAADCMVLPSDTGETWGLVANEAIATSLPCIVSDHCGCAEDLIAPICSDFVYPMGDVDSLAGAIISMTKSKPSQENLFVTAERFDLQRTVETLVQHIVNRSSTYRIDVEN